eukprot:TRINITY_DN9642_c0_g1_i1.p1 TRINITY_DN9642_c0_g1~~TRINITY_DN9642_c0_g1_i1.p1  ORF type:complete len:306 (-),score=58.35 TRINITY_DN9642_c0_g1_i1:59-928(-)
MKNLLIQGLFLLAIVTIIRAQIGSFCYETSSAPNEVFISNVFNSIESKDQETIYILFNGTVNDSSSTIGVNSGLLTLAYIKGEIYQQAIFLEYYSLEEMSINNFKLNSWNASSLIGTSATTSVEDMEKVNSFENTEFALTNQNCNLEKVNKKVISQGGSPPPGNCDLCDPKFQHCIKSLGFNAVLSYNFTAQQGNVNLLQGILISPKDGPAANITGFHNKNNDDPDLDFCTIVISGNPKTFGHYKLSSFFGSKNFTNGIQVEYEPLNYEKGIWNIAPNTFKLQTYVPCF